MCFVFHSQQENLLLDGQAESCCLCDARLSKFNTLRCVQYRFDISDARVVCIYIYVKGEHGRPYSIMPGGDVSEQDCHLQSLDKAASNFGPK